jgi:triosephosphate isomerase
MRPKIIAGNWKMYTTPTEGKKLAEELIAELKGIDLKGNKVIVFPPSLHIQTIASLFAGINNTGVGAQNCHYETEGAFTGEISAAMIKDAGGKYVIIGHSERRHYFNEDNTLLAKKVVAALEAGLTPVYCCGETLDERESEKHFEVISIQINEGLFDLAPDMIGKVIVAYEPVWAIGTGKTASPDQAQEMHFHIRNLFAGQYGNQISDHLSILYGGSMKPGNAAELLGQKDIDGGLIGGASLKASDFAAIIKSA